MTEGLFSATTTLMRLALYQPEIPQNAGTLMRLSACLGVGVDIIEPCGFVLNDRRMKRSGMDYLQQVDLVCHGSWSEFKEVNAPKRIVLLSPQGSSSHLDFVFSKEDILLLGQESSGVPESVFKDCENSVYIPMQPGFRSLNVAIAGAMVLSEALRQTSQFPGENNAKPR